MEKKRLAFFAGAILIFGLIISYVLSYQYGYEYLPLAALVIGILASIGPIYNFLRSLIWNETEGGNSEDVTRSSDANLDNKISQDTTQGNESFNTTSSQIDAGRDIRVGGHEVHYYNYTEPANSRDSNNETSQEEESFSDPGSTNNLDFHGTKSIPTIVEDGSLENVHFSKVDREYESPVSFWHHLFSEYDIHSTVDQISGDLTFKELKTALGNIAPFTWGHEIASFAISQEDGQWYGYGLNNFIEALSKAETRYQNYSGKRHGNEAAICIFGVRDGGKIAISCQPITPAQDNKSRFNPTRNFSVGFLMSGIPMNMSKYVDIAQQFNVELTSGLTESVAYEAQIHPGKKTTPIGYISIDRGSPIEDWADYAIIKNPFVEYPELKRELEFSRLNGDPLDKQYWDHERGLVSACEYVPINIKAGMEPKTENVSVNIHDIRVVSQTGLTIGHGHCNMSLSGIGLDGRSE